MSDAFLPLVVEAVEAKRDRLEAAFGPRTGPADPAGLAAAVRAAWRPMPDPVAPMADAYAVDGSRYQASLDDGATLLLVQASLVGPGGAIARTADVEYVPGTVADRDVELYASALVRRLELDLALAHLARFDGGVLYLDGSIYQNLTQAVWAEHLRARLAQRGLADLADVDLATRVVGLVEAARNRGVRLVGVAKTYKSSLLHGALAPPGTPKLCDAAALARWTTTAGYTAPLLVGRLYLSEESLAGDTAASRAASAALLRVRTLPAVAVAYVRFESYRTPLRVDLPCSDLGLDARLGDVELRPCDADLGPVLDQLRHDYADDDVCNVSLAAADLDVRLREGDAVARYLPVIAQQLGVVFALDRSSRRFTTLIH